MPVPAIAAAFHDAYERLAPAYGYKTREASAVPWEDVPQPNKALMVATVAELLGDGAIVAPPVLNAAYRERARLVAFLAAIHPAVISFSDPDAPGWAVITIDTPAGQLSWHLAAEDLDLFPEGLAARVHAEDPRAKWDGHTTEEKYDRLTELTARTHYGRRAAQAG